MDPLTQQLMARQMGSAPQANAGMGQMASSLAPLLAGMANTQPMGTGMPPMTSGSAAPNLSGAGSGPTMPMSPATGGTTPQSGFPPQRPMGMRDQSQQQV